MIPREPLDTLTGDVKRRDKERLTLVITIEYGIMLDEYRNNSHLQLSYLLATFLFGLNRVPKDNVVQK